MLDFIIEHNIYIGYIFEIIAALSGSYYLLKTPNAPNEIKYFAWFLWYVFLMDFSSLYALWAYFDNYETFPFLKDSLFTRNVWMHNWNHLISLSFFIFLFIKQLEKTVYKKVLKAALFIFAIFGIIKLSSSNQLFFSYDMSILFVGVFLLIIAISSYYFKLLLSDQVLDFKRNLLFYISVGLLVWHLCVPPIHLYSIYFSIENADFIKMHSTVLLYCNIFMYGIFSFAFIYCGKETHPSQPLIKT